MGDRQTLDDTADGVSYNVSGLPIYAGTERHYPDTRERSHLHWHEEIELLHILGGEMSYVINENYVVLKPGDFLFVNARTMHWTYTRRKNDCRYNLVQVHPGIIGHSEVIRELLDPVFSDDLFSYLYLPEGSDRNALFTSCLSRIISGNYYQRLGYELEIMQDVFTIFRNLFYFYTFEDRIHYEKEDADRLHFQNMIAFIYGHYQEKLTLEDIASSAHICRSKGCKLFQRFRQTTPIEFLNNYRIDQGARMLLETDNKVAVIAQECGFSQQSYFNRLFLKTFNCTPLEYRKRGKRPAPYRGRIQ